MKTFAILGAVCAALLFLVSCDGETPSMEQAQNALEKAGETAEKASGLIENLDTGKIEELARLAAEMEKAPEKAEELLKKHGLDRKQMEQALEKIAANPELQKVFDQAKELAKKAH